MGRQIDRQTDRSMLVVVSINRHRCYHHNVKPLIASSTFWRGRGRERERDKDTATQVATPARAFNREAQRGVQPVPQLGQRSKVPRTWALDPVDGCRIVPEQFLDYTCEYCRVRYCLALNNPNKANHKIVNMIKPKNMSNHQ
jgi:hypothetical protein